MTEPAQMAQVSRSVARPQGSSQKPGGSQRTHVEEGAVAPPLLRIIRSNHARGRSKWHEVHAHEHVSGSHHRGTGEFLHNRREYSGRHVDDYETGSIGEVLAQRAPVANIWCEWRNSKL